MSYMSFAVASGRTPDERTDRPGQLKQISERVTRQSADSYEPKPAIIVLLTQLDSTSTAPGSEDCYHRLC